MIDVYSIADLEGVKQLKKKLFIFYCCVSGALLLGSITLFILHILLPYKSTDRLNNLDTFYTVLCNVLTGIFIVFSFVFLGICFKRVSARLKAIQESFDGEKTESEITFISFDERIETVRFVEYKIINAIEWSEKTQDFMDREILFDKEKPFPDFQKGDIIKIRTHANVLISYGLKSE